MVRYKFSALQTAIHLPRKRHRAGQGSRDNVQGSCELAACNAYRPSHKIRRPCWGASVWIFSCGGLAAAAVVVAAAVIAAVITAAQAVAVAIAAAAEQEHQNDDPPAAISAPRTVVTHSHYLQHGFVTAFAVHSMLFRRAEKVQPVTVQKPSGEYQQTAESLEQ